MPFRVVEFTVCPNFDMIDLNRLFSHQYFKLPSRAVILPCSMDDCGSLI